MLGGYKRILLSEVGIVIWSKLHGGKDLGWKGQNAELNLSN